MEFNTLVGKTLVSAERIQLLGEDEIIFTTDDGQQYKLYHSQDCCEDVAIEDIAGDLNDLVGSPILKAEESTIINEDPPGISHTHFNDSYTWTFYHLATVKGYVTIRWYGSSNGYYSEKVDFDLVSK